MVECAYRHRFREGIGCQTFELVVVIHPCSLAFQIVHSEIVQHPESEDGFDVTKG